MQLQEESYPSMERGALPISRVEALVMAQFPGCVIKNRPCPAAQTISIADPKNPRLACAQCAGRELAPVEAARCIAWLKLVNPAEIKKRN